ncbi:MAG TPA: Uma2 family endonuclease [Myxococcales bacterium]|nr:Uma2 family endonuclease [Myxococcales bacterium]
MSATAHRWIDWKTYLELEGESNLKHEYRVGEMLALGGWTPQHAALAAAVSGELGVQLRGGPCLVYSSDLKIRVRATGLCTYPDVSIVCGKRELDPDSKVVVLNPVVLVEILSDSTEAYDRGEKYQNYRQIDSLREYVLVSHREKLIEVFRRGEDGRWLRTEARTNAAARLESIKAELSVNGVYEGIALHEP